VLAPALEGFSPTSEFSEAEEAQRMLAALAHDDRVSETVAKQYTRAKLHVDYARAVQWGMGFAADETKSAFARADALAVAAPGDPEYWALMYGRFANFLMRGEFVAAHEAAASYLRQAQVAGRTVRSIEELSDAVVSLRRTRILGPIPTDHDGAEDDHQPPIG
jgi:hypothetical protein